jgi:hypothetical protein
VAALAGISYRQVQRHVAQLVEWGELRRDKRAWPGSAACFTWTGGMHVAQVAPISPECTSPGDGMHVAQVAPHLSHPSTPSGPPGPRAGTCRKHPDVERYRGECWRCEQEEYHATHGGGGA